MRKFYRILIIVLIIIIIITYCLLIKFRILQGYERLEFILTVLGLFTTFGGAYFGAKIAGSESRKLFKQEIKMNDLQQHMNANITSLEYISEILVYFEKIKELLNSETPMHPKNISYMRSNFNGIDKLLRKLDKEEVLKDTSIIIYNDITKFSEKFYEKKNSFLYPISIDDTVKIIGGEEALKRKNNYSINWNITQSDEVESDKLNYFYNDIPSSIYSKSYQVSITETIKNNHNFFEDKLKEYKSNLKELEKLYKNMKYKNTDDLIQEYTDLYKD